MYTVDVREVSFGPIRAQGPGGQHADKASCAVHLRFDIAASSLPPACKERLLALPDARISKDGVLVLKAQQERSQQRNKEDALRRLQQLVDSVSAAPLPRKPTRPTRASERRRREGKRARSVQKQLRGRVGGAD